MFRPRFEHSTCRIQDLPPDQPECSASQPNPFTPGDKNSCNKRANGCIARKSVWTQRKWEQFLPPPVIELRMPGCPINTLIIILTDGSFSKVCDTIIMLCSWLMTAPNLAYWLVRCNKPHRFASIVSSRGIWSDFIFVVISVNLRNNTPQF
jgi:hypothetical protein